jgi:putative transposase
MTDKPLPQRKSPRLKDYDYSQEGAYFITICTHHRRHLFGSITGEQMNLSPLGKLAEWHWYDLPNHFAHLTLDEFIVMPNHIHGVLFIAENPIKGDTQSDSIDAVPTGEKITKRSSLGVVVGTYKAAVTRNARQKLQFMKTIWQSRYYDHIIRNENSLNDIRNYIIHNPASWEKDTLNS